MNLELKKIDVWSCVKISFILYGLLGLIIGIFYAIFFSLLGGMFNAFGMREFGSLSGLFTGVFGIFMAFFMAIFYAVIGSIFTAILVWFYNVVAVTTGGIKFDFEGEKPEIKEESQPRSHLYE
ncbi:MAG: DUF3566 domain-containing protein [candidate division Zixibacteria bacterium]|nr:DUF3566 domain-containing protein [candidate division Zixibacteria bacterium]